MTATTGSRSRRFRAENAWGSSSLFPGVAHNGTTWLTGAWGAVGYDAQGGEQVVSTSTDGITWTLTLATWSTRYGVGFGASDWDAPQAVTLAAVDDDSIEGGRICRVSVGTTVSSDPIHYALSQAFIDVHVDDTDASAESFTFDNSPTTSFDESAPTARAQFDLWLGTRTTDDVTLTLQPDDQSLAEFRPQVLPTITIARDDFAVWQIVVFEVIDDTLAEGPHASITDNDVAVVDTGDTGDTADTGPVDTAILDDDEKCGCANGSGAAQWAWLPLLLVVARRRRAIATRLLRGAP